VFVLTTGCWYPTLTTAGLRRRIMYQTRHTFASNALAAGEAPSWVATMLGHTSPEMLFSVYARYIPNRTRRDGKCVAGSDDGANGRRGDGAGRPCGAPEILPLTRVASG
jgi:integrase